MPDAGTGGLVDILLIKQGHLEMFDFGMQI